MSPRIVVVDDEADIRRLVVFTLQRRGYTVLEASDGLSALELIRKEQPDLVLLDVMMPELDGLEVARRLAAEPATACVPIIMLSASGQQSEIEAGLSSGADVYIVKPFVPRQLAAQVEELLRSHGANDRSER